MVARAVPEWRQVDAEQFRTEILPRSEPAVLRGAVSDWPAVRAGIASSNALGRYLGAFDKSVEVDVVEGQAGFAGQFFFNDNLDGVNFTKSRMSFASALSLIFHAADNGMAPSRAIQAAPAAAVLPGFEAENAFGFVSTPARFWLGGAVSIRTHIDFSDNIACVVAGRRRFLLFPPDQIANLYVGPLDRTPAGSPVSMVDPRRPDFSCYPRFADALEHALEAELEPGDAIFIPYMWWHHVDSLAPLNMLVNYWWNDAQAVIGTPRDALLFALLNLRLAPPQQREAWRAAFDYFVFQTAGDPCGHLPPGHEGVQGPITRERVDSITTQVLRQLVRREKT